MIPDNKVTAFNITLLTRNSQNENTDNRQGQAHGHQQQSNLKKIVLIVNLFYVFEYCYIV